MTGRAPEIDEQWYKDAIVYAVDVATFQDSNDDGIGDFPGLISRLDYLADLGVTCLWLLPFYPSPGRDNGYDVTDYLDVAETLGGLEGFLAFREAAAARGLRVVVDLVVQHTSDEHPWFRASRAGDPSYRNYYVWVGEPPARSPARQIFPGPEGSAWAWDDARKAWYLHQFYTFQPDLNVESEDVREEIHAIITRWLNLEVDGFRIDAASLTFGREALWPRAVKQPYQFMRHLRACVNDHSRSGVLMAEAAVESARIDEYFGGQDGVQMIFTFSIAAHLFLGLAQEEAEPIARGLAALPDPPPGGQWLHFLRNLDELSLETLSERDRETVYRAFGPDPGMRIYCRGIRRRLAPMLDGDQRRIRLATSLLLAMPGTPMIPYGDEIGLGENLRLPERQSVRAVMQWSSAPNGGFSRAPVAALCHPPITDGPFRYERLNVAGQEEDPSSLLHWMRRALGVRRRLREIGRGDSRIVPMDDPRVLALEYTWQGATTLTIHNLSRHACQISRDSLLDGQDPGAFRDCFGDRVYDEPSSASFALAPYGYRWLRDIAARTSSNETSSADHRRGASDDEAGAC